MRRRPLYLAPPGDVVDLEQKAERILDSVGQSDIAVTLGRPGELPHDLATMLLYRALHRGGNGTFLQAIDQTPVTDDPVGSRAKLLIVPGLNFVRHPETGADGRLVAAILRRLGFDVQVLTTEPRGSAGENGRLLERQLRVLEGSRVWVVSISKGTADFRAALARLGGWPEWLCGWINLSGVFQGTPLADRITGSRDFPSLVLRAIIASGGLVSRNMAEMRTDSPLWLMPVRPPAPECLLHVLGFPPSWTIEMRISHHYRWLARYHGPNDGVIPLAECLEYPGRIVPVWGADHFMRSPDLARLIYRLARYIAEANEFCPGCSQGIRLDQARDACQ